MIYLASPYSSPFASVRQERYEAARDYVVNNWQDNLFSPIVYCHELAQAHDLPANFEYWRKFNHEMMRVCGRIRVLQLPGWSESRGITDEINYAVFYNLPVEWVPCE